MDQDSTSRQREPSRLLGSLCLQARFVNARSVCLSCPDQVGQGERSLSP